MIFYDWNISENLEKSKTEYKILEENEQPDGSVIIKIKKQYNNAPVGSYLDWYNLISSKNSVWL